MFNLDNVLQEGTGIDSSPYWCQVCSFVCSKTVVLKLSARWPPIKVQYTIFCRPCGPAQQLL